MLHRFVTAETVAGSRTGSLKPIIPSQRVLEIKRNAFLPRSVSHADLTRKVLARLFTHAIDGSRTREKQGESGTLHEKGRKWHIARLSIEASLPV